MDWKKGPIIAIAIVLLFLLGTLAFTVLSTMNQTTLVNKTVTTNIEIQNYGLLSYNEQNVPYISLKTNISNVDYTTSSLVWYYQKPLNKVYFVTGQAIEAKSMETIKNQIEQYTNSYDGLEYYNIETSKVTEIKNGIMVITNGRMPQEIYNNLNLILNNNNVIIYVGMDIDYVVDNTGALIETHEKRSLENSCADWGSVKGEWNTINVKENGKVIGKILHINSSPDRIPNIEDKIFSAILYNSWQEPLSQRKYMFKDSQQDLILYGAPAKASHGYIRLITSIGAGNDSKYIIDDLEVSYPLVGRMYYNTKILKGEPFDISIKLRAGYLQPVHFVMSTEFVHNNYLIDKEELTEINIKQVWESTSTIKNNLHPGDYIISLKDQYNKVWALGYLHVAGLYAQLNKVQSGKGDFSVSIDGEPLTGVVKVYINDKYIDSYKISRGYLQIPLQKGKQNIKLIYGNTDWEFEVENNTETVIDKYINYLLPSLFLFAIVYVVFKKKKPKLYKLLVPKISKGTEKTKHTNIKSVISMFDELYTEFEWKIKMPINVREFIYGIKKHLEDDEIYITEGNAIEVLNQLNEKGIVEGYKDYYMLKKDLKNDITLEVIKRRIHDLLIYRGIEFKETEKYTDIKNLKLFYGNETDSTINNIEHKDKLAIVFESDDDKLKYLKNIMTSTNKNELSISVAITAQKLILLTFRELEDYV